MRSQSGRIGAAADPADTRRQLSAEWLQLTVSERREWRRRDASHHARSEADRHSLGSPGSARAAGSTPPRASRRKSPSTRSRSKHVRCPPVTHRAPVHNHDAPHRGLRLARACVPAPASPRPPSWQPFSTHRSCSPACTAYIHILNTTFPHFVTSCCNRVPALADPLPRSPSPQHRPPTPRPLRARPHRPSRSGQAAART